MEAGRRGQHPRAGDQAGAVRDEAVAGLQARYIVDTPYTPAGYEKPGSKGAPWWLQDNLVFVPRQVWIIEGQSTDPYYNFGKVIMYFDKEMYRIYWKLVHNRAGEYFYTAACGYHFVKSDETLLRRLPELRDRRERQDEPGRAGRPLPDLVHRAELGSELLLAPHADPHDRLIAATPAGVSDEGVRERVAARSDGR